jgi:hypothetical protein
MHVNAVQGEGVDGQIAQLVAVLVTALAHLARANRAVRCQSRKHRTKTRLLQASRYAALVEYSNLFAGLSLSTLLADWSIRALVQKVVPAVVPQHRDAKRDMEAHIQKAIEDLLLDLSATATGPAGPFVAVVWKALGHASPEGAAVQPNQNMPAPEKALEAIRGTEEAWLRVPELLSLTADYISNPTRKMIGNLLRKAVLETLHHFVAVLSTQYPTLPPLSLDRMIGTLDAILESP